ncbi:GntR family transcriptional regulator [Selenomonas sp. TAMA-11512]|uniref:GntR family transcriptional regulator n=1 Tax=Selenomonas sp. TAMA-11512 TaxID=3095337 RepID=UPI00308B4FA3|nr:GntR family transcriptional regulator [Selenomonas sp. TAMA-11512]
MLDRNNPKTLYQQLKDILLEDIESGKLEPSERIPSENELSDTYGVSRMTARSVLVDLTREGRLYRVPGKGTFVAEKIVASSTAYVDIRDQLEQKGYEVRTKMVSCGIEQCGETVAKHLGIRPLDNVFKIRRIRWAKDFPISIHTSYIAPKYSQSLTPELLEQEQLCVLLNRCCGLQRKRVVETLESVGASEEESSLLEVPKGHPLLLLKDVIYGGDDKPYEYTKVIFRGDKLKLQLTFEE